MGGKENGRLTISLKGGGDEKKWQAGVQNKRKGTKTSTPFDFKQVYKLSKKKEQSHKIAFMEKLFLLFEKRRGRKAEKTMSFSAVLEQEKTFYLV